MELQASYAVFLLLLSLHERCCVPCGNLYLRSFPVSKATPDILAVMDLPELLKGKASYRESSPLQVTLVGQHNDPCSR